MRARSVAGVVAVLAVAGVLVWAGSALLIQAWIDRRGRPGLAGRLLPYQRMVADEAAEWLDQR